MLAWIREHECPWDEVTSACAAYRGHADVLKWAREHDCEIPDNSDVRARDYGVRIEDPGVLAWLDEYGAP